MTKQSETMIQCQLRRNSFENGQERSAFHDCWLPKKFAVCDGTVLEIEGQGDGWKVVKTFTELPTAVVLERGQDYKKTRDASDI